MVTLGVIHEVRLVADQADAAHILSGAVGFAASTARFALRTWVMPPIRPQYPLLRHAAAAVVAREPIVGPGKCEQDAVLLATPLKTSLIATRLGDERGRNQAPLLLH